MTTSFALPAWPADSDSAPCCATVCPACRPWSAADDAALDVIEVVEQPERARFLVETIGHRGADRTVHVLVPRTVLLDVVADVVDLAVEQPGLFSGAACGGDAADAFCEPSEQDDTLVALHVEVVAHAHPLSLGRAAAALLLKIAERTSHTYVQRKITPTLTASLQWDWSEEVPLLP